MTEDADTRPQLPEVQPSEEEVQQLVRGAQHGEEAAFSRLYEVYFHRVYRFVALRVDTPADAEDITEDVFLRMLESIGSFRRREAPFVAWIMRIAHNRVVDYWRRARTRTSLPLDEAPPLPSEREDPHARIELFSDSRDLQAALGRLTDLQRQVLALRFGAGLSVMETAAVMKRNDGAIKALQHSAVAALRRIMVPGEQ
ncbi:MAG: sigma-70 family RNA polymerase sigma factor [Chloroflexi bacterium]|nr:sigma-70 family RNA polymerase sigma factor [Chloroflexota bacterium]